MNPKKNKKHMRYIMTIHSMLAESFSGSISSIWCEIDTLVVDIVQDGSSRRDEKMTPGREDSELGNSNF